MKHRQTVVVDFLNIRFFLSIWNLPPESTIFFLFHRKNKLYENILIFLLNKKKYFVVYKRLSTVSSYHKAINLADCITGKVINGLLSHNFKISFFKKKISQLVFDYVYRPASIIEFVKSDDILKKASIVYISHNRYKDFFYKNSGNFKIIFYSGCGRVNDSSYHKGGGYTYRKHLSVLLSFILKLFAVVPRKWPAEIRLNGVLILHNEEIWGKYYSHNVLLSKLCKYGVVTNEAIINIGNNNYFINRLSPTRILSYLIHIYKGIKIFSSLKSIVFMEKILLLKNWIDFFFFDQMLKDLECLYVYSSFETVQSSLYQSCASYKSKCVSISSTYSLGYLPVTHGFTHQVKDVDVYFIWGKIHAELFRASGDKSRHYVISGYLGSSFIPEFVKLSKKRYSSINRPIITYYDTSIYNDLFCDHQEAIAVVKELLSVAVSMDAVLIIKTKKNTKIYDNLLLLYPNNVKIATGRSCLSSSVRADVVIGYLSSTPAAISGVLKKNVLFYDPNNMIYKGIRNHFSEIIVNSIFDLKDRVRSLIINTNKKRVTTKPSFDGVDMFADFDAQNRMGEYINDIVCNSTFEKNKILKIANNNYITKNGKNTIINGVGPND